MPDVDKDAADRLMGQVRYNARNCEPPTPAQVGAVLHALADFTAINSALSYHPDRRVRPRLQRAQGRDHDRVRRATQGGAE